MTPPSWLPGLICLPEYEGDWNRYVDAIYHAFILDFMKGQPVVVTGRKCFCKRYPLIRGKVATFWHLISSGEIEDDRLADLRRCERIRWPRAILERFGSSPSDVLFWENERKKGDHRLVLALPDLSYLIVLADRRSYVVLWTAYVVFEHQKKKLRKEYDEWRAKKAGAANR